MILFLICPKKEVKKMELKAIATIKSGFPQKFGIPRQSRLVTGMYGTIIFEKEYAVEEALRGLEEFSHIWLIWGFSEAERDTWSPTVRPPRLGGNRRVGVFSTRSPFRPNPLGLSCVRLVAVENGTLIVDGADLMDGTPIYDIKPYLSFADSIPDAENGFADGVFENSMTVNADSELLCKLPTELREPLIKILKEDPRPAYQNDDSRSYGFVFYGFEIKFTVKGDVLSLLSVTETE